MQFVTLLTRRSHPKFHDQKPHRKFFHERKNFVQIIEPEISWFFWNNYQNFWLNQLSNLFRNNYQNFLYKNASRSRLVSRATMIWSALDFHDLRDCSKYPYRYNWINRKFFISLWSPIIYEISILLQSMIQNFISIKNFW